ncbi:MAG: EboA domain-containing protein [Planctomycetes bacterium]|nr:EboA domain-containing protein [Planctomycetota bacterium]
MSAARALLQGLLDARLAARARGWLADAAAEVAGLAPGPAGRFPTLISLASRALPRGPLAPNADERGQAAAVLAGWNPERWSILDAGRAVLVLSRADLASEAGVAALEDCFRHADLGELVSLYRTLCLLPEPQRFAWRAGEGCRSSMRAVYEAAACDSPLPSRAFDDGAWRQLVIKAVFVGAPLWRVHGLDQRLDPELARMALDLVDERRAAGRRVQPELWLALGSHAGERGAAALERELAGDWAPGRAAAALGLARAGRLDPVRAALAREDDPLARAAMESALAGAHDQFSFAPLHGLE